MKFILLMMCAVSVGCLNLKDGDRHLHVSAGFSELHYKSKTAQLDIIGFTPEKTHKAVGAAVAQGALGVGSSFAESGILGLFR